MDAAVFDDSLETTDQRSSGEQTSEEDEPQAQMIVFYPNRQPVPYKLHIGVNVVGRQSSFAQRDAMRLHQWSSEYPGTNVHGIFLESTSVSSAHAVIYLEAWGDSCFVKDLKSRNKTFVKRGGKHIAIEPEQKQLLHSGDTLTFGALKCRVSFGANSEGNFTPPLGSSPVNSRSGSGLSLRASSRAVSIGQRTASPGTPTGRSASLDKCPSLQEWFQHPARIGSASAGGSLGGSGGAAQLTPFASTPTSRSWDEENGSGSALDMPSKPSFGFGPTIHEGEEHISSDPEPETPRIDRPAVFYSPNVRQQLSPFASKGPGLDPMMEDEQEDEPSDPMDTKPPEVTPAAAVAEPGMHGLSSLEMGAETLAQLKTVPLKGTIAGEQTAAQSAEEGVLSSLPGTPGTAELSISPSPSNAGTSPPGHEPWVTTPAGSVTDEELDLTRGRPIRDRQKSPTPKRSRSGRVTSPDKPRSKSPRLQRGFYVPKSGDSQAAVSERHLKLDEIRDAVHDIWTDM